MGINLQKLIIMISKIIKTNKLTNMLMNTKKKKYMLIKVKELKNKHWIQDIIWLLANIKIKIIQNNISHQVLNFKNHLKNLNHNLKINNLIIQKEITSKMLVSLKVIW